MKRKYLFYANALFAVAGIAIGLYIGPPILFLLGGVNAFFAILLWERAW